MKIVILAKQYKVMCYIASIVLDDDQGAEGHFLRKYCGLNISSPLVKGSYLKL